jgi:DNA-binding NarL/FixJ family response regulator
MAIGVLLADDHKIVREGLRTLIEKQPDIEVVAEAEDGPTAVRLACELTPQVVIMDISMPGLNGVDATRQILEQSPEVRVIALSMHRDRRFILEMLKAGALGYLLKNCAFEEISHAIRTVAAGGTYLSSTISDIVVKDYVRRQTEGERSVYTVLTAREREVLQLVAEGHSTKEIAFRLRLSIKTVETHRQQIMSKLDIHTIAELTKYAVREGITTL